MMKKFLFKSLKFTVFATVFFALLNVAYFGIVIKRDHGFRNRMESLKFDNPDFEVLAFGASTSFDAFDTELLTANGFKSYNMAIAGSSVKTSHIQLKEYLDMYASKPEYILLGCNAPMVTTFDDEYIIPEIEVTMKDHKYSLNDVPIFKFKWMGFELLKRIVSETHREARLELGQLKFQKNIPDQTDYEDQELEFDEYESSFWIGEVVELCQENDMKLIIIEMPGYKATQNLSKTGHHTITCKNGLTADLYNFNSQEFCSIFVSDADWVGNSHLNEFGAIKFTNEVIRLLNELEDQL